MKIPEYWILVEKWSYSENDFEEYKTYGPWNTKEEVLEHMKFWREYYKELNSYSIGDPDYQLRIMHTEKELTGLWDLDIDSNAL